MVADLAVVRNVRTGHEEAVVSHPRHAVLLLRGTVDRDTFAEDVVIPDHDLGGTAAIAQILGFTADDNPRMEPVVLANRDMSGDGHIVDQSCTATDRDLRANDAEGTDLDIVINDGLRIDDRVLGNDSGHGPNSHPG